MMREPRGASEKFHEVLPSASGKRPNTTERGKDDYSLIEGLEVVIGQFQLPEHPSHGFDIAVRLNQMGAEQVETQPVSLVEIWSLRVSAIPVKDARLRCSVKAIWCSTFTRRKNSL